LASPKASWADWLLQCYSIAPRCDEEVVTYRPRIALTGNSEANSTRSVEDIGVVAVAVDDDDVVGKLPSSCRRRYDIIDVVQTKTNALVRAAPIVCRSPLVDDVNYRTDYTLHAARVDRSLHPPPSPPTKPL